MSHLKLLPPKLASTCTSLAAIATAAGICLPVLEGGRRGFSTKPDTKPDDAYHTAYVRSNILHLP